MNFIAVFLIFFSWSNLANGVEEWNVDRKGFVLHGYDPVAYHNDKLAVKGSLHGVVYKDAKFLFSSAKNRNLFLEDPSRYVPAYGGYCSYGVRVGKKFDIDPQTWRIVNEVLYFQLDPGTQILWERDLQKNISIADRLWPKLEPMSAKGLSE